jgi:hypothetical protein
MSLRKIGLVFVFSATLASGLLVSSPAQAFTLTTTQCANLNTLVVRLTALAGQYPNSRLIAYLLQEATDAYTNHCSS